MHLVVSDRLSVCLSVCLRTLSSLNYRPTDIVRISPSTVRDDNRKSGLSATTVPEMSTGLEVSSKEWSLQVWHIFLYVSDQLA